MNRDKKLYNLMIKNHPTIIGWFIHKGIVERKDGFLGNHFWIHTRENLIG